MTGAIRPVTLADVPAMLAIYGEAVLETPITWEYEVPTIDDFEGRVQKILTGGHPWIVLEDEDSSPCGYAYAGNFRDRYGYRFCCESSIYLLSDVRGKGYGRRLYEALLEILRRQGFVAVIGGITYPNPASIGLHEALGFKMIGIHEAIGYKFGAWHSACFMQKELNLRTPPETEAPLRFDDLLEAGSLDQVFRLPAS